MAAMNFSSRKIKGKGVDKGGDGLYILYAAFLCTKHTPTHTSPHHVSYFTHHVQNNPQPHPITHPPTPTHTPKNTRTHRLRENMSSKDLSTSLPNPGAGDLAAIGKANTAHGGNNYFRIIRAAATLINAGNAGTCTDVCSIMGVVLGMV